MVELELVHGIFVWSAEKERQNIEKHGVEFDVAAEAFLDPLRIIAVDEKHSREEERRFCIGEVRDRILTVRFTYREGRIRIFGAGYWRAGRSLYEKENKK